MDVLRYGGLASSFFAEISKQLSKKEARLKTIAGKFATYGQILTPAAALFGAGSAVQGAVSFAQAIAAGPSVYEQHEGSASCWRSWTTVLWSSSTTLTASGLTKSSISSGSFA